MIGLDTNVLVRYLVQDDPSQAARATRLIESELSVRTPGLVSLIVLCELLWVLSSAYGVRERELVPIVERLLEAKELRIESPPLVRRALRVRATAQAGLADVLIGLVYETMGGRETVTFDRGAARLTGWRLLESRPS